MRRSRSTRHASPKAAYRRIPVQAAWTAPTARMRSIQLRAEVQSSWATPWSTAAPASAGTETRAIAQGIGGVARAGAEQIFGEPLAASDQVHGDHLRVERGEAIQGGIDRHWDELSRGFNLERFVDHEEEVGHVLVEVQHRAEDIIELVAAHGGGRVGLSAFRAKSHGQAWHPFESSLETLRHHHPAAASRGRAGISFCRCTCRRPLRGQCVSCASGP